MECKADILKVLILFIIFSIHFYCTFVIILSTYNLGACTYICRLLIIVCVNEHIYIFGLSLLFLQYLCECQFDDNLKFKTAVNEEDPDQMRLQPIGRDREGLLYWFQLDQDQNVRVYVEEQDDLDGSSWRCIVR